MRKIVTVASATLMVLVAGPAIAQDEPEPLSFTPVEIYACNFNDDQGPADLAAVVEEWNEWLDGEGVDDYFAITMTPEFFGERNFDFAWLGVWPDGNAMGAGTDMWLTQGQEIGAKFARVVDCVAHVNFASVRVKEPPETDMAVGDMFVLEFSNCSMTDGTSYDDYLTAQKEWNAYADEHGFVGGSWNLWPVWGETADADYDFKAVNSAPNYTTVGANWARMAAGHYQKSMELFDPVLDCDSPRVYTARVLRLMADDE